MIDGRVIRGIDVDCRSFIRSFDRLREPKIQIEVRGTLRSLLMLPMDSVPRKLHLHQMNGKFVASRLDPSRKVPAWSLHVTSDDRYKASFTYEGGAFYFRICDEHDVIDKNP